MARDINRLKRIIDMMDRPEGANMKELCQAYEGQHGGPAHIKTIERVLSYLRNCIKLTIKSKGYKYYLVRDENFQLFNTAASTTAVANLLHVEPGMDTIVDIGAFKFGTEVSCLNEVVTALKSRRIINIIYRKLSTGQRENRIIQPMFLRWYASQWYLFARDTRYPNSEAPRAFRLDGVEKVEFGETFELNLKDSPTFFAQKFLGVSGDDAKAVEVTLHMDSHSFKWIDSTIDLAQFNAIKRPLIKPINWWEVKINIHPNAEFMELLMRIQSDYKVVGPETFKFEFRKRLKALLDKLD